MNDSQRGYDGLNESQDVLSHARLDSHQGAMLVLRPVGNLPRAHRSKPHYTQLDPRRHVDTAFYPLLHDLNLPIFRACIWKEDVLTFDDGFPTRSFRSVNDRRERTHLGINRSQAVPVRPWQGGGIAQRLISWKMPETRRILRMRRLDRRN